MLSRVSIDYELWYLSMINTFKSPRYISGSFVIYINLFVIIEYGGTLANNFLNTKTFNNMLQ